MKVCPTCGTMYQDGDVCTQCGSYLTNAQSSYSTDPYYDSYNSASLNSYSSGYNTTPTTYSSYPQNTYSQQSYPSDPYANTSYSQTAAANSQAAQLYQKPVKKRTGLIVFLLILILLLAAGLTYLIVFQNALDFLFGEETVEEEISETDNAIATSAWNWYSEINGLIVQLSPNLQTQGDNGGTENAASTSSNTSTGSSSSSSSSSSQYSNSTATAPDSPIDTSSGYVDETLIDNEFVADVPSDEAPNAAAADAVAQATEGLSEEEMAAYAEQLGEDYIMNALKLSVLISDEYGSLVNEPMQSLSHQYPDLVKAWNNLYSLLIQTGTEINDSSSSTTNTSNTTTNSAASSSGSTTTEGEDETADAEAAAQAEINKYVSIVNAAETFKKMANEAGLNTSEWQ